MKKLNGCLVKFALVTFVLVSVGCGSANYLPPVESLDQPPPDVITRHRVDQGETLYALAWRYGTTVDSLAQENGLTASDSLSVGQTLRLPSVSEHRSLQPSREHSISPDSSVSETHSRISQSPRTGSPQPPLDNQSQHTRSSNNSDSRWVWPSEPRVLSTFEANNRRRQGIDLAGDMGDSVVAASQGMVVYAGDAISGLGNLIIVDHGNDLLSAYAHNNKLLVEEGDSVQRGQRIADMGNSGSDRVKLHFEIRRHGVPVDPLVYLPAL